MSLPNPHQSAIETSLADCRFIDAAALVFQDAQRTGDAQGYVNAALYFLLGQQAHLARDIAAQLSQTEFAQDPRFHILMAFVFLLSERPQDAAEVLSVLSERAETAPWAQILFSEGNRPPLEVMSESEVFRPNLTESAVVNKDHTVYFCMRLRCRSCNHEFSARMQNSIFQICFAPCHSCLRPYLVTPLDLSSSLAAKSKRYDTQELQKIDELCWVWVHNWRERLDAPKEVRHDYAENIYSLAWNTLRFSLSEHYVRLFNRIKRGSELL